MTDYQTKALRMKYKKPKDRYESPVWELDADELELYPEDLLQVLQSHGISSWLEKGKVSCSGLDRMELHRFMRQSGLLDEAEEYTGGMIGGHKGLDCVSDECRMNDAACSPEELRYKTLFYRRQELYDRIDH
jgi:hypothetical protein